MDEFPWLVFALGVSAVTLAQVLLSRFNPDHKIPVWWGRPSIDTPLSRFLRVLGVLLMIFGASFISQVSELRVIGIVGLFAGGFTPYALVIIMHNSRVGDRRDEATT